MKLLTIFEQGAQHFCFALVLTNYYSCLLRGRFCVCKGRPVVLEDKFQVNRDVFR